MRITHAIVGMTARLNAAALALVLVAAGSSTAISRAAVTFDCAKGTVHCVDDDPGAMQEFATIQAAVNRARKGHTVVVFPGEYAGFRVNKRGTKNKPITIVGVAGARVVSSESRSNDGIYLQRARYVVVEGFEVDGGSERTIRYGIGGHDANARKPMRGVTIRDNVVHGAWLTAIYMSHTADSLIEGNLCYDSGEHGIYLANAGSDGTTLRANRCWANDVNGIHFNGDDRLGGDGLHKGLVVEGNVIYDNVANGIDADGVQDSVFRNNLIYDNGRHGLRVFAIDAAAGPRDLVIVNNSFEGNRGWAVKLTQDGGGHTVFNNILLSTSGSLAVDHADVTSNYNIVGNAFSGDGEDTVVSLGTWRATGQDLQSIRSTPNRVYARVRKSDYRLKRTSPGINAGIARLAGVSAPGSDIDGVKRPQGGATDIGAYERTSTSSR